MHAVTEEKLKVATTWYLRILGSAHACLLGTQYIKWDLGAWMKSRHNHLLYLSDCHSVLDFNQWSTDAVTVWMKGVSCLKLNHERRHAQLVGGAKTCPTCLHAYLTTAMQHFQAFKKTMTSLFFVHSHTLPVNKETKSTAALEQHPNLGPSFMYN